MGRIKRLLAFFVASAVIATGAWLGFSVRPTNSTGTLELLRDIINVDMPGATGIQHYISFVLPVTAPQVLTDDWILIELPLYGNVRPPTEVFGGYGQPVISVDGTTVRITNIVMLPGTGLQILGLTADNPGIEGGFNVTVKIADDPSGFSLRNQATTVANTSHNWISVTASITNTLPTVTLSGFTAPASFVTLTENDTAIGTTTSALNGQFIFTITGLDEGQHSFRLFATDSIGRVTAPTVLNYFLLNGTVTTASNILLSSTMSLDKSEIPPGDSITVSGSAKPNSQINIFLESPLRGYSVSANGAGDWSYTVAGTETATFTPGQYRTYTIVQDDFANQSVVSNTLTFTVTSPSEDNPEPDCDISKGDLNCDGRTNLTDFSILLFHWRTNHKKADINRDGIVNLTDFSIMMFYFRR
jgi:hypothetical protein